MQSFQLNTLLDTQAEKSKAYLEFLREASMSIGIYQLPAGGIDPQQPHTEDEVYYVISGRAEIQVDGEIEPVEAGSIVFVAANIEHKFMNIQEDLVILVFFSPAEYTLKRE